MSKNRNQFSPKTLYKFCRNNPEMWSIFEGSRISHKSFGQGEILEVSILVEESITPTLLVQFDNEVDSVSQGKTKVIRLAINVLFTGNIRTIELSPDKVNILQEFMKQKAQRDAEAALKAQKVKKQQDLEANARVEFKQLRDKYEVSRYHDQSPISPLFRILLNLEQGDRPNNNEQEWLLRERLYPILAIIKERQVKENGLYELAVAGKYWRMSHMPIKAIQITDNIVSPDNRVMSMILTMRGGAFRDIEQLVQAEDCARKSIELTPQSYYPYNLLGAIYFQKGLPEEGEEYFEKAKLLGSSFDLDNLIMKAVENSGYYERIESAKYLLQKNPDKYKWALTYLNQD